AQLQSEAAAFKRHHGRCAPRTVKSLAAPAGHHSTAVAATDSESQFEDGRQNHNTVHFIYSVSVLRGVVWNIHDFADDCEFLPRRSSSMIWSIPEWRYTIPYR